MTETRQAIHDGHARAGYYKMRRHKGGDLLPVVIWERAGELVCRVGDKMADVNETWLFCSDKKVSKAEALFAFENGRWPTDAPTPLGHNEPPSDDPFENLTREIEAEELRVKAWVSEPHEGTSKAETAANWLGELRKLEKRTTAAFDTEKAPVLEASQRVDKKWRDLKARAAAVKKLMDDCYQSIGRKEKARLQAIADKKAAEEAAAKHKQLEAEQARLRELAEHHNIPHEPEAPPQLELIPAAPVRAAFGGSAGPKIAVRAVPPKAVVEDWAKVAMHYAGHDKLRDTINKLIAHDIRDGRHDLPGVKIIPGDA